MKRKSDNLLADETFGLLKKEKLDLENQLLRGQVQHQEERSILEKDLLKAKIDELQARTSFFQALTSAVQTEQAVSDLFSLARRNYEP